MPHWLRNTAAKIKINFAHSSHNFGYINRTFYGSLFAPRIYNILSFFYNIIPVIKHYAMKTCGVVEV
jgi:hypothetical protein